MHFKIERFKYTFKQNWQSGQTYYLDDIVYYQGKAFVCVQSHVSQNLLEDDISSWEVMIDGRQWRGDWSLETFYASGDIVKYNGFLYRCIESHTSTNIIFLGLPGDINKWVIQAETPNWTSDWQPETTYLLGDVVKYNANVYICRLRHASKTFEDGALEADQEKWSVVVYSDNWKNEWSPRTRYIRGDIVKYFGIIYRCIEGHVSSNQLLGLEQDRLKWEVVLSGVSYQGIWQSEIKYYQNDVVKFGETLYIALETHSSSNFSGDLDNWQVYLPGLGFEEVWNSNSIYGPGDIVLHGGYTYIALEPSQGIKPTINGLNDAWELLDEGYKIRSRWNTSVDYNTGDLVNHGGNLYVALTNNSASEPSTSPDWQIVVPGINYRAEWEDGIDYYIGDVVVFRSTAYYCFSSHTATGSIDRPDLDIQNPSPTVWQVLILGTPTNVLAFRGDLLTFDLDKTNFEIGDSGTVLQSSNNELSWKTFGSVEKVYFVAKEGEDEEGFGLSVNSPFRTVRYACEYIFQNETERTPATIRIATGIFSEQLPISVPAETALVGDELRSTTIQPAEGFETENMFLVRNACGIRNMTLQGLTGELGDLNEYLTRRVSAGAYVSLDPGDGPDDASVWITTRSPYIQNVSTFGKACIGMKIDGSLHNGGNKSIVANDFTQVLDDGIGYWAEFKGRSELVSVFTYFCHIGYLATNGGILRGTNGNNSYGTYGSVAEGIDIEENPIEARVDNRDNEAQIFRVLNNQDEIFAVGFSNAGQNYTSAEIDFGGSGINAEANITEFRDGAIGNIRTINVSDSVEEGGLNYTSFLDAAQTGDNGSIQLAATDTIGTADSYSGLRVFIEFGRGAGQYGYISNYDPETKIATISRESDNSNGWDHIVPGYPIEEELDGTTRYTLETRIEVDPPGFDAQRLDSSYISDWKFVANGSGITVAVDEGNLQTPSVIHTTDGVSWTQTSLGLNSELRIANLKYIGTNFIISLFSVTGLTNKLLVSADGENWQEVELPISDYNWHILLNDENDNILLAAESGKVLTSADNGITWTEKTQIVSTGGIYLGAYGKNTYALIDTDQSIIYTSTNFGTNWNSITIDTSIIGDSANPKWSDFVYGNGKFVAISESSNIIYYSFDLATWYESFIESFESYNRLFYSQGMLIAFGEFVDTLAKSYDGRIWKTVDQDSTPYSTTLTAAWTDITYDKTNQNYILIAKNNSVFNKIRTGISPIVRPDIRSSRIKDWIIYEPGSGYESEPSVNVYDNQATIDVISTAYVNNGVIAPPEFLNRGEGYTRSTATVTGDGFAEIFQTGNTLQVKNLTKIPSPGANINIFDNTETVYSVNVVENIKGSEGDFTATIQIFPDLEVLDSPNHNTGIIINETYSQIRLTNHDFLDIGTGNVNSTRYPELYVEGVDSLNRPQPQNEVVENGGGRVFYTSTDQNGNFRVGELFQVEQDTGIVTISASQFDITGLTELTLGGVRVGGSSVVVREFSKDPLFVANSNNIVPTQRAIASFINRQLAGGGSNAVVDRLIAGQTTIDATGIGSTTGKILVKSSTNFEKTVSGTLSATYYYQYRSQR